jgi:hypothetical protein
VSLALHASWLLYLFMRADSNPAAAVVVTFAAVVVFRYLSRSYVQPQWLFDSLNHRWVD